MLLAADIGNSSIDLGVFDDRGTLRMRSKIASVRSQCSDEYAVLLDGVLRLNGMDPKSITESILCSVVPSLTASVSRAIAKLTGSKPLEVGPGVKTGLNIKIDSQTQLGADLAANAVAAMAFCPLPLTVVDIGTATTFTVLNAEGVLEGVIICPGVRMSLDALASSTAALPDVSITPPRRIIARNTNDAMNAGVLLGHAFQIDGFLDRIASELKTDSLHTVVTGGLADVILPYCRAQAQHRPDLTLEGLRLIAEKNRK